MAMPAPRLPDPPRASRFVSPVFCYNPPRDSERLLRFFYTRDVVPHLLLSAVFQERGYRLGEPLLNYPPPGGWRPGDLLADCTVPLGPAHEVLWTTRLPLDDEQQQETKQVLPGRTLFEEQAKQALRGYFALLVRSQICLARPVAAQLRAGFESRREILFKQRVGAHYKEFLGVPRREAKPKVPATAAFLLRKPGFRPDGSTLVLAFAMDGTMSLIWSYLLARVHSDWLFEPGFRMVELTGPALPERPLDLRFALDWKAEEIVHIPA